MDRRDSRTVNEYDVAIAAIQKQNNSTQSKYQWQDAALSARTYAEGISKYEDENEYLKKIAVRPKKPTQEDKYDLGRKREKLRSSASTSGLESDRVHATVNWGGDINSTLATRDLEMPLGGRFWPLETTHPGVFQAKNRLQRLASLARPENQAYLERRDWGTPIDVFSTKNPPTKRSWSVVEEWKENDGGEKLEQFNLDEYIHSGRFLADANTPWEEARKQRGLPPMGRKRGWEEAGGSMGDRVATYPGMMGSRDEEEED